MKLYTVDGNIGSGKSTFLSHIAKTYSHIITIQEPVNEWFHIKNEHGVSLFEMFYQNPERYSYLFQMHVLNSRFMKIKTQIDLYKHREDVIILSERSIFTDLHIFVSALQDTKQFSKLEYDVFLNWFDTLVQLSDIKIEGMIYIRTNPNNCHSRIQQRSRQGENVIDFTYLQLLHEKHEKWLNNSDIQTLTINGDNTFDIIIRDETSKIESFLT